MTKRSLHPGALRIALLCLSTGAGGAAQADVTFNVNTVLDLIDDNTNDGVCHTAAGNCSLRAAIMQANHWSNPEFAIINVPAGTYPINIPVPGSGFNSEAVGDLKLTSPLTVDQRIVINGAGPQRTIIDGNPGGNQISGAFSIATGRSARIAHLTIRGGNSLFGGGGISNRGTLSVIDAVIEHNRGGSGGGIENLGDLTLIASTIRFNVADTGGGVDVFGTTRIRDSTLHGNSARYGGGIYNNNARLYVVNSTISNNVSYVDGGGIFSRIAAFLYNTSVIGNDADHDRNEDGGNGGGVYVDAGSRMVVVHSLIAGNTQRDAPIDDDCHGALETYGRNLFGEVANCAFPNTTTWGTVLLNTIGPLQDNGGPTLTHALLPNSQAINGSSDPFGCVDEDGTPLTTDQRGAPRVVGPHCDAGAFEFGARVDAVFSHGFE